VHFRELFVEAAADAEAYARDLAARLGASGVVSPGAATKGALVLAVGARGLSLRLGDGPGVTAAVQALARRPDQGPDLLWRAVLSGREPVVEATAGLGADGFHLAAKGASVTLVERSPLLVALLADALERARRGDLGPGAAGAAARVRLHEGDAREVLSSGAVAPEEAGVVYLDPMFPAAGSRALPPKGMALLRELLARDGDDGGELLRAARQAATRRVVVKRHLRDGPLGGVAPSGSLRGRTVRFDVYPPL
jgi:16S rRNA (guanine1516-N2)-methyltransferase